MVISSCFIATLTMVGLLSTVTQALTDIPGQLRKPLPVGSFSAPPKPIDFPEHLKKRLDTLRWEVLPPELQRALLWDAGLVRPSNKDSTAPPGTYVQVYVPRGRSMNDIFLSKALATNGVKCRFLPCNTETSHYVTDCAGSLARATSCGLDAKLFKTVATTTDPSWSEDGSINEKFDPAVARVLLNMTAETGGPEEMFVIKEVENFPIGLGRACPMKAYFSMPCRGIDFTKAEDGVAWRVPDMELGVELWLKQFRDSNSSSAVVPSASSSGKDSSSSNSLLIGLLSGLVGIMVVICIVLFVLMRRKEARRSYGHHSTSASRSNDCVAMPISGAMESPVSNPYKHNNSVPRGRHSGQTPRESQVSSSASTIREIELINEGYRKRSTILSEFCDDQALMMKRLTFGSLQLLEPIAQGANGDVWKGAYDGQIVAIKRLRAPESSDRADISALESFTKEIRLASTMDHPNIVKFIGFSWRTLPELCMVSEHMGLGDLSGLLESRDGKRMTWRDQKVAIAIDIATAIVYLHSLQPMVIHRDLKSKNVLLDEQLVAKLSDFGLSRERGFEETMTSGIGTLLWTAPEVLRGQKYDEKADLYSFGVLLTELDTCLPPYSLNPETQGVKSKSMHLMPLITSGRIQPAFSPSCPNLIQELARECLDQNSANRPTAMQVVYRLRSKIRPLL